MSTTFRMTAKEREGRGGGDERKMQVANATTSGIVKILPQASH